MRNQSLPFIIIALLVIIIAILIFGGKHSSDESFGQKVGNTIDRATGERK